MKLRFDTKNYIDFIMAIMTGSIIAKIKKSSWTTGVGFGLIFWYVIAISQRVRLFLGLQQYQLDMQELYIIIDFLTIAYLLYAKSHPVVNNIFYKMTWLFLFCWYFTYCMIDIFVIPISQPNTLFFHILAMSVSSLTIMLILWNEIFKHKTSFRNIFKW